MMYILITSDSLYDSVLHKISYWSVYGFRSSFAPVFNHSKTKEIWKKKPWNLWKSQRKSLSMPCHN